MKTKQINPLNLTLTISLKEEDDSRMQLVYASQVYQTFFCVFGAFEIDRTNPMNLKLQGVHLQLINYKGLLNLGIVGVSNPIRTGNGVEIIFKIKASVPSGIMKYYQFDEAIVIKNGKHIDFHRILEPMDVDPVRGVSGSNVYDTEFYERDGLYNRKRTVRLDVDSENFSKQENQAEIARWFKSPKELSIKESFKLNKVKYHQGELIKWESVIVKAPGARCPKSSNIANY